MKYLLLILLFPLSVYGETFSGQLLEKGTKRPIANASIFLLPLKIKIITDEKGFFLTNEIIEGEVQCIINQSGYSKFQKTFILPAKKLRLFLEKEELFTFETTVTDQGIKRDNVTKTLQQKDFKMSAGTFGGDPIRAAQNLAGVNQSQSAQIIIQGASPDDTGYTIDGHQIPLVFHFQGLSSVIPPEAVSQIDFLPAGYGAEFSRAIGGFIGLQTVTPSKDLWQSQVQLDIFNVSAVTQGPVSKKGSVLFGARYSYIGTVLEQVAKNNDNFNLTTAPTFADVTMIYQQPLSDKDQLKIVNIFSRDELKFVLNKPFNDDPKLRGNFYQRTEFFRVIPQWKRRINEKQNIDLSFGAGTDSILFDVAGQFLDINVAALTMRSEFSHTLSSKYTYFVGLDHRFNWFNTNVNLPVVARDGGVATPFSTGEMKEGSFKGYDAVQGYYFRLNYKPIEKATLSPQLRMDIFPQTSERILAPRLAGNYQLNDKWFLRSSLGTYTQPPEPQEVVKGFGNPTIQSPKSHHYTLGATFTKKESNKSRIVIDGGFFYKDLEKLVVTSSDFRVADGNLIRKNYDNKGRGDVKGIETSIAYDIEPISLKLAYTYLESNRYTPGIGKHPSAFDQTHNINLTGLYTKNKWSYSARLRYVTGNPYTPVVDSTLDGDGGVYVPTRGDFYSRRLPAFFQLDFRVDRRFVYDEWILSYYLDIQNLTNHKNAQGITYSYNYKDKDFINSFPILPTFGVKGEF